MSSAEPPLPVPDDDPLDAAASAVVDGVATPDEAALVAAAPDGQARVDALRAVAGAVGRPVPDQDQAAAARVRAAALDAFAAAAAAPVTATVTAAGADDGAAPAAARPNGLEDRRASVTSLPPPPSAAAARWLPRLSLVAAALFLLLAVGAVAAGVLGDDDAAERQTSAAEVAAGATTPPPEQLAAPAAPEAAAGAAAPDAAAATSVARAMAPPPPGPTTLAPVVDGGDVGSQTEVQDLAQRAAAALDSPPDPATAASGSALPSDVQACVRAGPPTAGQPVGDLRYRAVGRFRTTPAVVLAYDRPGSPSRLLLVLARRDCALLASAPF